MATIRNTHTLKAGNLEGKKPFGKRRRGEEDSIKINDKT
jgi:hypothetical protein